MVEASPSVAQLVGLDPSELERPEFALIMSGNASLPGTSGRTYAQCYGEHGDGSVLGRVWGTVARCQEQLPRDR